VAVTSFGGLEIAFDEGVLTPRPWTIAQSQWAIELLGALPDGPVLELCCGAGQIGLVVAHATGRRLVQVDDDERACAFARRNADVAGQTSEVRHAAIEDAVGPGEKFVLVLADPPYIPSEDTDRFDADPAHAIDGGPDGLDVARRCIALARHALDDGGAVLVQTAGPAQADDLAAEATGFARHEVRRHDDERAILLLASPAGSTVGSAPPADRRGVTR
jgi:methylase of polypeptide subunit release factors